MDFIERLLGFSPDGGDGSFEVLLFAIPVVGIILFRSRAIRRLLGRGQAGQHLPR